MLKLKPQYFGIAEQILLSASNMVASLVVVKVAGMRWFGIYSFIFVLCTLAGAFLSTLLHRQMILDIASRPIYERRQIFLTTLVIQALIMVLLLLLIALIMLLFSESRLVVEYRPELFSAVAFVCIYNFYDLCRQYLYVLDGQAYSFRCTLVYVVALIGGFAWLVTSVADISVVAATYALFCAALMISLLSNRRCQSEFLAAQWVGWSGVLEVLIRFFDQGRFRLVGMMISWLQNHSMNPFLMWLAGPVVAGFYSMARLLVMPMAVVNQGLINSTTPQLRRLFQSSGSAVSQRSIARYNYLNLGISAMYLLVLGLAHVSGVLDRYVPSYRDVVWYLLIWIATLLVTMYRHWLGQYFVVSMQFRFMMQVGFIALVVSMSGMITMGFFFGNVYLALIFVIVGELVTIIAFNRHRERRPT